jgi:hypothetical protein
LNRCEVHKAQNFGVEIAEARTAQMRIK